MRAKIREGKDTATIYSEDELLDAIKDIVLSKVSRMTHIKKFSMLKQEQNESCEDFFSRLQTMATCCGFNCKHCNRSNVAERVREKFVLGLKDKHLQTTILRTETYKPDTPLSKLVEEAITLEQSIRDQNSLGQQMYEAEINEVSTHEKSDEEPSANSLKFKLKNQRGKMGRSRNSKKSTHYGLGVGLILMKYSQQVNGVPLGVSRAETVVVCTILLRCVARDPINKHLLATSTIQHNILRCHAYQ